MGIALCMARRRSAAARRRVVAVVAVLTVLTTVLLLQRAQVVKRAAARAQDVDAVNEVHFWFDVHGSFIWDTGERTYLPACSRTAVPRI